MYRSHYVFLIVLLFILLAILFYVFSFGQEIDVTFLTIATFLFAIFTGFFIARQGNRYSAIRDSVTDFDGNMSFVYRSSGHFGADHQTRAGDSVTRYYQSILKHRSWDYPLTHKTQILTELQGLMSNIAHQKDLSGADNMVLNRMIEALRDAQSARKRLVALYEERVPRSQWVLIYFLTIILLTTLATISSETILLASLLKAAFATSVVFVMLLLHQFDQLQFFESVIGEHSAQDVLDIIAGRK